MGQEVYMDDRKARRFYRMHIQGGRFETWCQDHARRDLERGKRLREVPGPCAVCAGQVEALAGDQVEALAGDQVEALAGDQVEALAGDQVEPTAARRLRAAVDLDSPTRAIPIALLDQLDPLVARLLAAVDLHDAARQAWRASRSTPRRWSVEVEDNRPNPLALALGQAERELIEAAADLASWWRS